MNVISRIFLSDEDGMIVSSELVILATVVVLGLIVGLTEVRSQVVSELGDVALANGQLDQSFTYDGTRNGILFTPYFSAGSAFVDRVDTSNGQAAITTTAGGVAVDVTATQDEG